MILRANLDQTQLEQLKLLFEKALAMPRERRNAFVSDASGGDILLKDELSSLLDAHDASDGYFEKLSEEIVAPALSAIDPSDNDEVAGADRRVSHYEILERIGRGGMGVVYKARDTRLGRTVALKFLPRHHASNPDARARLLAEARAASALDHPNIGVVYEIGEAEDGRQFIAMGWYDGETLKEKARAGSIEISAAAAITLEIGNALTAAHAAGIIHRDVKPSNVIVTRSGLAKLVDFGIAKLMNDDEGDGHATAGTVAYMSPEQTRHAQLDARTDIWSLGVLLYEVLAGKRPFRGDSDEATISAIRNDEPEALSSVRSDVPAALASVVDRCLRKEPSERYQTAEQLCDALRDWNREASRATAGNSARVARTDSTASHARQKVWLYAAAASFAIVAVAWGYNRYSGDTRSAADPAGSEVVSVAVLNLSDDAATDSTRYLSVGLSEDIRTELARISEIAVPAFASAKTYQATAKPVRQIAQEMAAKFVVVGSVERTAPGPRVHIELIEGHTGKSRWSRDYESDGAMMIARDAAREVASAVGIALTRDERDRLSQPPTRNSVAYEVYLRGRYAELSAAPLTAMGATSVPDVRRAQAYYSQARSLDQQFALARARLAMTHMFSARTYDTTDARLDQARLEAETALRMDSRLAAPHEALAAYWGQTGDLPKAIEQLETGLRSTPNDIALLLAASSRYLEAGRWEDAIDRVELAMRLDPRNPVVAFRAATSYGRLRRNGEGMKAFNRLLEITPDDHEVRIIKGQSYLRWKGTTDTLHAALERVPPDWDFRGMATFGRYTALMVDRRYRDVLSMLDRAPTDLSRDGLVYHPRSLMRAEAYHRIGDFRQARHHYELARQELSDSSAARPNDSSIRSALALAYAGLNRKREAIAEADRAMALRRVAGNSRNATAFMGLAVEVFGRVGEPDRAFEMIELMLTMPSGREVTLPFLKVWPGFDSLRGDPRFNAIVERFAIRAN